MSKKRKKPLVMIGHNGIPCPRCGRPTQIREHRQITAEHRAQPFYYSPWFRCMHADCKTTLIMLEEYRVWNDNDRGEQGRRLELDSEQLGEAFDPIDRANNQRDKVAPWE